MYGFTISILCIQGRKRALHIYSCSTDLYTEKAREAVMGYISVRVRFKGVHPTNTNTNSVLYLASCHLKLEDILKNDMVVHTTEVKISSFCVLENKESQSDLKWDFWVNYIFTIAADFQPYFWMVLTADNFNPLGFVICMLYSPTLTHMLTTGAIGMRTHVWYQLAWHCIKHTKVRLTIILVH